MGSLPGASQKRHYNVHICMMAHRNIARPSGLNEVETRTFPCSSGKISLAFGLVLLCNFFSMIKRAASAVLGLLAVSLSAFAQQSYFDTVPVEELRKAAALDAAAALTLDRPDVFSTVDGALLLHSLPVATLLDGRRFPLSGDTGRVFEMFPVAFLNGVDVQKLTSSAASGTDAPGGTVDLRLNRYSAGGEFGIFYGKSDGKYGFDLFQSYIVGGVGNDKFNITAGAMYEESKGHEMRLQH